MKNTTSHFEQAKELIFKMAEQDENDKGKTVRVAEYYSPLYEYVIASELAIMNDYLGRIAEALENKGENK